MAIDKDLKPFDIKLDGKLNTYEDPSRLGKNFRDLQNMRYVGHGTHLRGVAGMTEIGNLEYAEGLIRTEVTLMDSCYQAIGLYTGGTEYLVIFPMFMDARLPQGMLCLIHDYNGRVFIENEGMVSYETSGTEIWCVADYEITYRAYQYPACAIIDDTYWLWVTNDVGNRFFVKTFKDGVITLSSALLSDTGTMDYSMTYVYVAATASGVIVVPAKHWNKSTSKYGTTVAYSTDYGVTFNEVVVVETSNDYTGYPTIGIDSNGVVWLAQSTSVGGVYKLLLYKSADNGASWSYVNTISTSSNYLVTYPNMVIDGTDIYLSDISSNTTLTTMKIYKSSDTGVTFNVVATLTPASGTMRLYGFGVHNDTICCTVYEFATKLSSIWRSTDGGTSFSNVFDLGTSYGFVLAGCMYRNSGDVWVYTAGQMYEKTDNQLCYLISEDDGATWTAKSSPVDWYIDQIGYQYSR